MSNNRPGRSAGGLLFRLAGPSLVALFAASCGWMTGEIKDQEVKDLEKDMRVTSRETSFTPALRSLGRMLLAYDVPRTPVQCKNIGNETGEKDVPSDLYTMIASSIGKIGPSIVFIPYDAQYVISESTTGGTITRTYPQVVIAGALTGFDKEMFQKEREAEASGGWAGAQGGGRINASGELSRLSLDLNMLHYRTQAALSGVTACNAITLTKDSLGWGIYGYYMGNGGSFDYSLKEKQGVHAAIRNLVEYSVLELIGKFGAVPYWRCCPGANPDQDMIGQMRDRFIAMQKDEQIRELKRLLFLHGVQGIDRQNPEFSPGEEAALKDAMRVRQVSELPDLYLKLWLDVPLESAARRVLIDRRNRIAAELRLAEKKQQTAAAEQRQAEQRLAEQQREHEAKVKRYNETVTAADRAFRAGQTDAALTGYREANVLFGGEDYPRQMIARIESDRRQQERRAAEFDRLYTEAERRYAEAEKDNFRFTAYQTTLQLYQQAARLRPDDARVRDRIAAIQATMNKYRPVTAKENGDW